MHSCHLEKAILGGGGGTWVVFWGKGPQLHQAGMDGCNLLAYESWSSKCRIFPIMTTFTYESFSRAVWRWCLDPNSTSSERVRPGSVGVKSSQTSQHKSTCQGVVKHTEENVVALKKSWFSSLDKLVTLRDISRCDLDPAPCTKSKETESGNFFSQYCPRASWSQLWWPLHLWMNGYTKCTSIQWTPKGKKFRYMLLYRRACRTLCRV